MSKENKNIENKLIETPEVINNNEVMTPPVINTDFSKEVDKHVAKVNSEYKKAEKAFINVACEMRFLYENDNYLFSSKANPNMSFEEFASENFGFKKTQSYALIGIVDRFGVRNDDGTFSIAPKYKDFGQTQLVQIASLTDKQIEENIKPSMKIADIKKIVKQLKSNDALGCAESDTIEVETVESETEDTNGVEVVTTTDRNNTQAIMSFDSYDEFVASLEGIQVAVAKVFKGNPNYKVTINYEW